MKKRVLSLFVILLLASCGSEKTASLSSGDTKEVSSPKITMESILADADKGKFKEGELLVKFRSGVSAISSVRTHQAIGSKSLKRFSIVQNLEHVKLPESVSVKDAIKLYMSDPNVEYAEPNYIRCASQTPNDPFFVNHQQWALLNTGEFAGGFPGADIKAPAAWDITTGNPAVIVAVLDSGIDFTHADLTNNIYVKAGESCDDGSDHDGNGFIDDCRGWNFVDNNNNTFDDLGHGTHVAGIIGAFANNGLGMTGVMWRARLMPVKIFNASSTLSGSCVSVFASDEIAGIEYAVNNGAKIINASFSSEGFCASEATAIAFARDRDVLIVAAAGNDNFDLVGNNNDANPFYPASYKLTNVISVAATDQNDRLATFSNFGPDSVHVAAPGVYILSTVPFTGVQDSFQALCTGSFFTGYDFCSGTSMAAPHVAGLAGLIRSAYPHFNSFQVRGMILKYVDFLPSLENTVMQKGRINAYRSLSALLPPTNLFVTAISSSELRLNWSDNATGEYGYTVERMLPDGSFTLLGTTGPDATSFTDSGLNAKTTYIYRVKAVVSLPNPPSGSVHAESTPAQAQGETLSAGSPPPPAAETGGGGGCSIGAVHHNSTAVADTLILLFPLLAMALLRRKK